MPSHNSEGLQRQLPLHARFRDIRKSLARGLASLNQLQTPRMYKAILLLREEGSIQIQGNQAVVELLERRPNPWTGKENS